MLAQGHLTRDPNYEFSSGVQRIRACLGSISRVSCPDIACRAGVRQSQDGEIARTTGRHASLGTECCIGKPGQAFRVNVVRKRGRHVSWIDNLWGNSSGAERTFGIVGLACCEAVHLVDTTTRHAHLVWEVQHCLQPCFPLRDRRREAVRPYASRNFFHLVPLSTQGCVNHIGNAAIRRMGKSSSVSCKRMAASGSETETLRFWLCWVSEFSVGQLPRRLAWGIPRTDRIRGSGTAPIDPSTSALWQVSLGFGKQKQRAAVGFHVIGSRRL
jgi:hypothetical protein